MPRRLVPDVPAPSAATTIGVRTEHLRIVKGQRAMAHGRVTWIEHLGDQNHLHIRIDEQDVVSLVDPDAGLTVGDDVGVTFVRPLFFGADGLRLAT